MKSMLNKNMKKLKNTKGLTLMELLVAIPMLAFVFLSMAYMLASSGNFTSVEIAKFKTQTAANNVLMLIKSKGFARLDDTLTSLGDSLILTTTGSEATGTITKTADKIPTDSVIHPDGVTQLSVNIVEKNADAAETNLSATNKICVITVTAPDFYDISTVVKTVSF